MSTPSPPAGTSIFILLITRDDEFVVEDDGEEEGDSTVDVRFLFYLIPIFVSPRYNNFRPHSTRSGQNPSIIQI